jgi:hypothetical protein
MADSREELLDSLKNFSKQVDSFGDLVFEDLLELLNIEGSDGPVAGGLLSDLELLRKVREKEAKEQRLIDLFGSLEVASEFVRKMKGKSKEEVLVNFNALTNVVASQKKEKEAERLKKLRKEAIPTQIILVLIVALLVYLLWD